MSDPAARLERLQGWADFLCGELHEPLGLEKSALREVRELSWTLRDKLSTLRTQMGDRPKSDRFTFRGEE